MVSAQTVWLTGVSMLTRPRGLGTCARQNPDGLKCSALNRGWIYPVIKHSRVDKQKKFSCALTNLLNRDKGWGHWGKWSTALFASAVGWIQFNAHVYIPFGHNERFVLHLILGVLVSLPVTSVVILGQNDGDKREFFFRGISSVILCFSSFIYLFFC